MGREGRDGLPQDHMTTLGEARQHKARKTHACVWCDEKIKPGELYRAYMWMDHRTPVFIKMHPECYRAMQAMARNEPGPFEFDAHERIRGCTCALGNEGHGTYQHCLINTNPPDTP